MVTNLHKGILGLVACICPSVSDLLLEWSVEYVIVSTPTPNCNKIEQQILLKSLIWSFGVFLSDPTWASYNIGIFICQECAGIHRSLGAHISKVKSIHLDNWEHDQLQVELVQNWNIFPVHLETLYKYAHHRFRETVAICLVLPVRWLSHDCQMPARCLTRHLSIPTRHLSDKYHIYNRHIHTVPCIWQTFNCWMSGICLVDIWCTYGTLHTCLVGIWYMSGVYVVLVWQMSCGSWHYVWWDIWQASDNCLAITWHGAPDNLIATIWRKRWSTSRLNVIKAIKKNMLYMCVVITT